MSHDDFGSAIEGVHYDVAAEFTHSLAAKSSMGNGVQNVAKS
jgi:hypothetical protein